MITGTGAQLDIDVEQANQIFPDNIFRDLVKQAKESTIKEFGFKNISVVEICDGSARNHDVRESKHGRTGSKHPDPDWGCASAGPLLHFINKRVVTPRNDGKYKVMVYFNWTSSVRQFTGYFHRDGCKLKGTYAGTKQCAHCLADGLCADKTVYPYRVARSRMYKELLTLVNEGEKHGGMFFENKKRVLRTRRMKQLKKLKRFGKIKDYTEQAEQVETFVNSEIWGESVNELIGFHGNNINAPPRNLGGGSKTYMTIASLHIGESYCDK